MPVKKVPIQWIAVNVETMGSREGLMNAFMDFHQILNDMASNMIYCIIYTYIIYIIDTIYVYMSYIYTYTQTYTDENDKIQECLSREYL